MRKNFFLQKMGKPPKGLTVRALVVVLGAVIGTIAIQYFIVSAKTVPTEVMGVVMGVTSDIFVYGSDNYFLLFWFIYFLALIPFVVYGALNVGKWFTALTVLFIVVSTGLGAILAAGNLDHIIPIPSKAHAVWFRLLYGSLGGVLYGFGLGLALTCGGSSGGTDFLAARWSEAKRIKIFWFVLGFALLTLILAAFTLNVIGLQHKKGGVPWGSINWGAFFVTLGLSVCQCTLGAMTIKFVYPKDKEMVVKVKSNCATNITDAFWKPLGLAVVKDSGSNWVTLLTRKHLCQKVVDNIYAIDPEATINKKSSSTRLVRNVKVWD